MYIVYDNKLYDSVDEKDYYKIITRKQEKTDKDFYSKWEVYVKKIATTDSKIREMYDVNFYVVYHDTSRTMEMAVQKIKAAVEKGEYIDSDTLDNVFHHRWRVNGGNMIHQIPKIENNEVAIVLSGESYSEDWVMFERGFCSKIVDIYDCEKLLVRYTYSVRDGKALAEKEVVEVTMEPEDFKAEKLKYRVKNI